MHVFEVFDGKRYLGTMMGATEEQARKRARESWPTAKNLKLKRKL